MMGNFEVKRTMTGSGSGPGGPGCSDLRVWSPPGETALGTPAGLTPPEAQVVHG